jgi:hypothetical protein
MGEFDRITRNPAVMTGKACVRGMRVTVSMIVGQIGSGVTVDELLADYPYLECCRFGRSNGIVIWGRRESNLDAVAVLGPSTE